MKTRSETLSPFRSGCVSSSAFVIGNTWIIDGTSEIETYYSEHMRVSWQLWPIEVEDSFITRNVPFQPARERNRVITSRNVDSRWSAKCQGLFTVQFIGRYRYNSMAIRPSTRVHTFNPPRLRIERWIVREKYRYGTARIFHRYLLNFLSNRANLIRWMSWRYRADITAFH